ncbi:uncharacterized protein Z520_01118 [Fonsecaea multimorphosa CBS 102226]|uniref:MARVEL domain-containing protein n=1 Tax=Fonsecaea multimorphosa CBS 102226 TaxID=1442371 RepID=A0A0D2K9A2_9EURO|nr:uncharacterized protein Z520_01118 [Fonsecaea multimorphosa CBS 102226]KIY02653.1 hypothetical protein Z520_01118 [Fonsecaea multimorphosa CBS 102226]OAL31516.1 hypothetical protein AYO22_01108 [Fonsecaea multimorphosa]
MVSKAINLTLRAVEFAFIIIIMGLIGNVIATAFAGNPSLINYDMFVAAFGMFSLFYLILVAFNDSFMGHPIFPIIVDLLNVIFLFCAAIAMAAELHVHSCSNNNYTLHNHLTNGANDREGRCREEQAATAFLWFTWAAWMASLFFSVLDARSGGVNLRGPVRSRGARPAMSQV